MVRGAAAWYTPRRRSSRRAKIAGDDDDDPDIDVAAREEAARVREEKRRQRAGAMRGATAVGETGRASCLPARTASKIAMVLGAHPRADPRSVRDVPATGSFRRDWRYARGVTRDTNRRAHPRGRRDVRATHGMGAAADAKIASAALADRFVHEMAKVNRADAQSSTLILRETFAQRADDLETALVLVKDASERACASDALGRLLDIVVALSAILDKGKAGAAGDASQPKKDEIDVQAVVGARPPSPPPPPNRPPNRASAATPCCTT